MSTLEFRKIPDVFQWWQSRVAALKMDYTLSFAERLVQYYMIEGNPAGFRGYEWQIGILNDMHPRQSVVKRSQVGLTLIMMMKCVLFLEQYGLVPYYTRDDFGQLISLHPTCIYTFENADKVRDFSSDRLKEVINENQFLQGLLAEGEVDQVRLKKFGKSSLYLGGRRNVESVTSIPANVVLADEWDRTNDFSVGEQLESRLKASKMFRAKTQRGLFIKYSTPEAYGVGVSKEYDDSDQMVFQIKCTRCNTWQEMIFPDSIASFYEKGSEPTGKIYYRCLRCNRELDWSTIGQWDRTKPLKTHNCEWVPRRSDYYNNVTKYGEGIRGYRVPWAYSAPVEEVMRDRDTRTKLYFFHHVLGEAFADDSTGLIKDNFLNRIDDTYQYDRKRPGWVHVMGVDQGCYVTIWGLIPFSREEGHQFGKWVKVHFEHVPNEKAFSSFEQHGKEVRRIEGRLSHLMKEWEIDLCVIDAEPNLNDAHNFSREFEERVLVNHSTSMKNHDPSIGFTWVDFDTDANDDTIWVGKISEDKTSAIDAYFDFIREGNLVIAAGAEEEALDKYIEQHLNIKKVYEERSTAQGLPQVIAVYRAFGPDHYGHSGKFAFQAAVLFHKLDKPTSHIIIPGGVEAWKMGKKTDDLSKVQK